MSASTGLAPGAMIFGFDEGGTLGDYGWSTISSDGSSRQFLEVVPPTVSSPEANPQDGTGFVGLHIPAFGGDPFYTQDGAHDTLWVRSPEFTLDGSGDLTAWLQGGTGFGADATGKLVANVPTIAFDSPGDATFPSFLGLALRNVDTGVFDLAVAKPNNGSPWELVTMSQAQLLLLDQSATYTLDLLDVREGGWGWTNMDSVSIPGTLVPEPGTALLGGLGLLALLRRRRG